MLTPEQHIENLVHHIEAVRRNCLLLGRRLMAQGRHEFGRLVIARGFGLRSWIRDVAVPKYQIDTGRERFAWVQRLLDVLLEDHFAR
jgi:hypothetical protein